MADGFHGRIILCWPTDRNQIAQLNQLTDACPFVPTIEHSLSTCDSCRRSIWIARQQLQLANSPFTRASKLCMFCATDVSRTLNVEWFEIDVAPGVQDARKRIL
jgi:hypothetical protein